MRICGLVCEILKLFVPGAPLRPRLKISHKFTWHFFAVIVHKLFGTLLTVGHLALLYNIPIFDSAEDKFIYSHCWVGPRWTDGPLFLKVRDPMGCCFPISRIIKGYEIKVSCGSYYSDKNDMIFWTKLSRQVSHQGVCTT